MAEVVGIKFKSAGKIYYFAPGDRQLEVNDEVIVETSRGKEYGYVAMGNKEVAEDEISQPLKEVIRKADDRDKQRNAANLEKKEEYMEACNEKIEKHGLDMKVVDVEHTFDNSKVVFYFTADGRVDFRELVKDLAAVFRMRIELRQIGVRDEAKMLGGIGHCGRNLCCNQWLSDFHPVSIKMAKAQNLSLNPTKISGVCGRLMCCLQYENDVYNFMRKGLPEHGETVKTPDGMGIVWDVSILEGKVRVKLFQDNGEKTDRNGKDADRGRKGGERRGKNSGRQDSEGKDSDSDQEPMRKLSTEIYVYDKQDVKKIYDKRKKGKWSKGGAGHTKPIPDEVKELLKD